MQIIINLISKELSAIESRKRFPAHPGRILKNLYLPPLCSSNTQLAEILGVSRNAVSNIVNGHKAVMPEMALRLARAFPASTPGSWIALQKNYDLWQTAHKSNAWRLVKPVKSAATSNLAFAD